MSAPGEPRLESTPQESCADKSGHRAALRSLVYWSAPAAYWVETGAWASALWALTLQWTLAALAFVGLRGGLASPLLVTALWCVAQSLLAVAFRPPRHPEAAQCPAGVGVAFAAVSSGASVVLLCLGWSSLSLMWLEPEIPGQVPSGVVAFRPVRDSAPTLGEIVVVPCSSDGALAVARVVALPGETYWQRGARVCFPSSGCLPQRTLRSDSTDRQIAVSLEVQSGSYYVLEKSEARQELGGPPVALGDGELAVRVLFGQEGCQPVERISSELIAGRVEWWFPGL